MKHTLLYLPQVKDDLRHFAPTIKSLVKNALEEISKNPRSGTPLVRELEGLWKYRTKRYRILYEIHSKKRQVLVYLIDQRKTVYDRIQQYWKGKE